ncbi:hypothetical protein BKA61DRAFT_731278 [Leptodontidium sp. MPI-SDFR-AT-0119]|nr:hypothetical protein BKA61DRAFT_731278 [Leptodontidium sp. MPI-SDFR-AT-0119]
MKCSSEIRMLLAFLLTFTLLLSVCAGGMTPPDKPRNQKGLSEAKNAPPSTYTSPSASASATTVTFQIPAAATTAHSSKAKAKTHSSKKIDISQKATKLLALQTEFTANFTAHAAFMSEKLAFIDTTLSEIARDLAGAKGRSKEVKILRQILFSEKNNSKDGKGKNGKDGKESRVNLKELLHYLETMASDDQQINLPAIMMSVHRIVVAVRIMEMRMGVWEEYVRGIKVRVRALVGEMDLVTEGQKELGDTLRSIKGVMVRVKSWLPMAKAVDEDKSAAEDKSGAEDEKDEREGNRKETPNLEPFDFITGINNHALDTSLREREPS